MGLLRRAVAALERVGDELARSNRVNEIELRRRVQMDLVFATDREADRARVAAKIAKDEADAAALFEQQRAVLAVNQEIAAVYARHVQTCEASHAKVEQLAREHNAACVAAHQAWADGLADHPATPKPH